MMSCLFKWKMWTLETHTHTHTLVKFMIRLVRRIPLAKSYDVIQRLLISALFRRLLLGEKRGVVVDGILAKTFSLQ